MNGRLGALVRGSSVIRSAAALYGSTLVTAGLGFAFWAVAARLASPAEVGIAAAAISMMQLVGSFCTLGLGSLLIAELARRPAEGRAVVSASLALSGGTGLVVSWAVAFAAGQLGVGGPMFTEWRGQMLFAAGCAVHAATAVLDLALVGAHLSGRQFLRNAVFAAVKLGLLPVAAATAGLSAVWVYLVWLLGAVVSVIVVLTRSRRPGRWLRRPASPLVLRGLGGQALGHHVINVSAHAPSLVLPIMVARLLHPADNAGFYMALQIASFGWAVAVHLSTALFAISAHDHTRLRAELRTALRISTLVAVAGTLGSAVSGWWVLGIFGPFYQQATLALVVLFAATLPSAVKGLFIAVCRVQGRLRPAATTVLAGSALEIAGGIAGAAWGVTGVAAGFLAATVVQAVLMWPRVAQAAGFTAWWAGPKRELVGAGRD